MNTIHCTENSTVALLVIDVQVAFQQQDKAGAQRCNPDAETRIAQLITGFRANNLPVIHVHHHSLEPNSLFRAELPGSAVQSFAAPINNESVYIKNVNSAFIGTSLEQDLHTAGIDTLIMCGATANHCVETSTRMAGNLGFRTFYISDAVWAYEATGPDGVTHTAEEVLSMSVCNLNGEFAAVINTEQAINDLLN